MSEFPDSGVIFNTDPSWTAAQAVAEFQKWLTATMQLPGAAAPESTTISGGQISPTKAMIVVDTEAVAAADELGSIATDVMHDGAIIMIRAANSSRTVTLVHGTGLGQIETVDGADQTLSTNSWTVLLRSGTRWVEVRLRTALPISIIDGCVAIQEA